MNDRDRVRENAVKAILSAARLEPMEAHRQAIDRAAEMHWRVFGDGSSLLLYLGKHQVAAIHAECRKSAHRSEGSGSYIVLNPWQITFRLPGSQIMMAEKTIESAKEAAEKHVKAWIEEAGLEVKNACS